ncbi:MAG: PAS domain-containing sensor histidine kinase [Lysobacteraceae bacterium]|nr:MAG: PAS domain-containing sensor histidine kinase [Xanthomonadaceae bacterium]
MSTPLAPSALADEARQFSLLLRSVTDYAIYMLDGRGYIRSWNAGGERIKGYGTSEIVGQHFSRFYTPEDIESGLPARSLAISREQGRFEAEGWRVRKDGTRFRANVVIDPIHDDDGQLVGYAKVTRDITERHEAQEALQRAQHALVQSQKMEAIGKFTLGLAHDFNNLLTVIINSLDMIEQRQGADGRTRNLVQTALRASDRGALLTRQLLAFGRGQTLSPEQCDVNGLLTRSLDLYRRAAGDNVSLDFEFQQPLPGVRLDTAQFEAAVLNLVCNSRDAMPEGGTITLRSQHCRCTHPARPEDPPRDYVCVSVVDDGPGIPLDLQERVFEPFFTTKEVGKGSGLGLSQVFGFAGQSNGFADLASSPRNGTAVRMCFPALEH